MWRKKNLLAKKGSAKQSWKVREKKLEIVCRQTPDEIAIVVEIVRTCGLRF